MMPYWCHIPSFTDAVEVVRHLEDAGVTSHIRHSTKRPDHDMIVTQAHTALEIMVYDNVATGGQYYKYFSHTERTAKDLNPALELPYNKFVEYLQYEATK